MHLTRLTSNGLASLSPHWATAVLGGRAVEHLRDIGFELQMVPSRFGAHIGGSDLYKVHSFGGNAPMSEIEAVIKPSVDAMFDGLVWWATSLREARVNVTESGS